MTVFDIIGPVMIGPSSSHTAGAVRLGRVAEILLSGSFARTYRGHGTDRALLAGIMGYTSDSEQIRDAVSIAKERGIDCTFVTKDIAGAHPNTAMISFSMPDGTQGMVLGASIGGGNIRVDQVNGMRVDFNGEKNPILVMHEDKPGVIARVTNLMHFEYGDVNICNFHLSRESKGGKAIMTIEIDGTPPDEIEEDIALLKSVDKAILIRRV